MDKKFFIKLISDWVRYDKTVTKLDEALNLNFANDDPLIAISQNYVELCAAALNIPTPVLQDYIYELTQYDLSDDELERKISLFYDVN